LHEHLPWSEHRFWNFVNEQRFSWPLLALDIYSNFSKTRTLDDIPREGNALIAFIVWIG